MMQVNINTVCKGDGYWSKWPGRRLNIFKLEIHVYNWGDDEDLNEDDHGELQAYFHDSDWDTFNEGLVYTDRGWLRSFRLGLRKLGFSWEACRDVDYSEQGMQSHEYVSMDIGKCFIQEFRQIMQIPVDV